MERGEARNVLRKRFTINLICKAEFSRVGCEQRKLPNATLPT